MLFVDEPSSKLFCTLCQRVFKDPVITSCGVRIMFCFLNLLLVMIALFTTETRKMPSKSLVFVKSG